MGPVRSWGFGHGRAVCTLWAAVPAADLLALLAEEGARVGLRVTRGPRSLQLRTRWQLWVNLAQLADPIEFFNSSVMSVTVVSENAAGSAVEIGLVRGSGSQLSGRVPDAMNRVIARLTSAQVPVSVTPWDRWLGRDNRRVPL